MTKTEIAAKIKNMISENLRIPENMLDDDAELFGGDIGLDSVDSLEIISGIDDLFGVDMTAWTASTSRPSTRWLPMSRSMWSSKWKSVVSSPALA